MVPGPGRQAVRGRRRGRGALGGVGEWSHFKDPRDKFKRYSNGLAMYIVHMSTLCNELNDLKVYSNIF